MKKKKIILVDMDGVLANFESAFLKAWKRRYPEELAIELENRTTIGVSQQYPQYLRNNIQKVINTRGFFRNIPPIHGGREALNELTNHGYSVFICTTPTIIYENCVLEKYEWVEEHLGREWTMRIILTKDKTLIHGNYLIDDKPEIRGIKNPTWEQIIFDAPYNRDITGLKRLKNWSEWQNILL